MSIVDFETIKNIAATRYNVSPADIQITPISGGSINNTMKLTVGEQTFFAKINSADAFPGMMKKEKRGLELLQKQKVIRTPKVLDVGEEQGLQFIFLEQINTANPTPAFWKKFGEQLAALHAINNEYCGLTENNYMGSLPQDNTQGDDWWAFFINRRLRPQIKIAAQKNKLTKELQTQFENLFKRIPALFEAETHSLLHGDLWSGNFLCAENHEPVLIDPAVYYGSRHMDMAMTTLFGGFENAFYESYHYHYPLPGNYKSVWEICNLYPLLIHLNLFGSSYLPPIERTVTRST